MKKGTMVTWLIEGASIRGNGRVITDEVDGEVLVAVNSFAGEPNRGFHSVINCTVTWLTPETTPESLGPEAEKTLEALAVEVVQAVEKPADPTPTT